MWIGGGVGIPLSGNYPPGGKNEVTEAKKRGGMRCGLDGKPHSTKEGKGRKVGITDDKVSRERCPKLIRIWKGKVSNSYDWVTCESRGEGGRGESGKKCNQAEPIRFF